MKKILEVFIDDQGEMQFNANNLGLNPNDPSVAKTMDRLSRSAMRALTKLIWKDQNNAASEAIRFLSMANIACDAQPYENIDQLFLTMMHNYLPRYEKYCNKLKSKYGVDAANMVKPVTWVNEEAIRMSGNSFLIDTFLSGHGF